MEKIKLTINNKEYNISIADTPELRSKGYQGATTISDDEGILFIFSEDEIEEGISMWMKDTPVALDIVFIDEDWEVIDVADGEPLNETLITEEDAIYVLEVKANSGIEIGDYIDLSALVEDEDDDETPTIIVLDNDGTSQMELVGGERIFSRKNTKTIIKMAKRALKSQSDAHFKALGNKVFAYIKGQDERKPEFVEVPD